MQSFWTLFCSCITKAISMTAEKFTDEGLLDVDVKDIVVSHAEETLKGKDYDATVVSLLCSARLDPYLIAEVFERGKGCCGFNMWK